jgi:hypothetical protein
LSLSSLSKECICEAWHGMCGFMLGHMRMHLYDLFFIGIHCNSYFFIFV